MGNEAEIRASDSGGGAVTVRSDDGNGVRAGDVDRGAVSEGATILSIIERAARDPNVDMNKMERLFEMRERIENRRALEAYNAAMARVQSEMPAVVRNRTNDHTKAKYADLYAIADDVLPLVHKHGFGLSFSECPATQPNCIGISCRASHRDGHSEVYQFNVPIDAAGSQGKTNKTATQAYGSTLTYGRRYATCGVFNVIMTDNDGNAPKQPADAPTVDKLKIMIAETKADTGWICSHYSVETLDDLTAKQIGDAMAGLAARKRAQQVKQ